MDFDPNLKLSPSFYLHEFLFSETAARMGRVIVPTVEVVENLTRLCADLLQPIRDELGLPMVITSGYRPTWLNGAMPNASNHSAHLDGRAADVRVVGTSSRDFTAWVNARKYRVLCDQLIFEGTWTHLAVPALGQRPRGMTLTAHFAGGGVTYTQGLA